MGDCSDKFPDEADGVACMPARTVWVLERWLGAIARWRDLAGACPGVTIGPSGVTEELDKLESGSK